MKRFLDWWRFKAWPIGKCVWCGKRFWREFPWWFFEEHCSKECCDGEMDFLDTIMPTQEPRP